MVHDNKVFKGINTCMYSVCSDFQKNKRPKVEIRKYFMFTEAW